MCPPRKQKRNIGGCSTIEKMKEQRQREERMRQRLLKPIFLVPTDPDWPDLV